MASMTCTVHNRNQYKLLGWILALKNTKWQTGESYKNEHSGNSDWSLNILGLKESRTINPYPTAFPYGNGMVLHLYQQQESSTTKTVHKVINKGLKTYV